MIIPESKAIAALEELTGVQPIGPDTPLDTLGIDSLDILQWLYQLEEDLGVEFDENLLILDEYAVITVHAIVTALEGALSIRPVRHSTGDSFGSTP